MSTCTWRCQKGQRHIQHFTYPVKTKKIKPNGFQPYYILSSFTVHYCNVTVKVTLKDNVTYFLIFELGKKMIDSTYPKYINTTLGPGPHTWNSTVSRFVSCRLFFFFLQRTKRYLADHVLVNVSYDS